MAQSEKGCALFILREGKIKMRLDKFLKVSRLIKRRTVANEACDAGRVLINGAVAKASTKVKKGDIIEIQFGTKTVKAEVLDLRDTTKKKRQQIYSVIYKVPEHLKRCGLRLFRQRIRGIFTRYYSYNN